MTEPAGLGRDILFDIVGEHIAVVTLNRPQKRNAVNVELAEALGWAVGAIERDDAVRVAILASSHPETFCAGADLAEIAAGRGALLAPEGVGFAGFVDAPRTKPWIAAVRGAALGGGCELALACDMIVAGEDGRFGLPEVKRGLFAGAGGVHRLPRALPRHLALELVLTGEPLTARRGHELGFVNRLAESERVLDEAVALAAAIAANAPVAVRESLHVARLAQEATDAALRRLSGERGDIVFASADSREGALAFLERRAPVWTGR